MKMHLGILAFGLLGAAPAGDVAAEKGVAAAPAAGGSTQDVIFLGENRPIFLRLRIRMGDKPLDTAWMDSVRTLHAYLDKNKDGSLTKEEAEKGALATLVRIANDGATALPRGELDVHPKDGVVSIDELSEALRTALGPFRVAEGKAASGRTDALFDHLDRDKDGKLTTAELTAVDASLAKLDLDEDELINGAELEPFSNPMAMQQDTPRGATSRNPPVPPILELSQADTSLRPVRLLIKRYDKGTGTGSTAGDGKLSRGELAIDAKAFAAADADGDGSLDTEELRRFLSRVAPDLELNVGLSGDASGKASVDVAGGGASKALPAGTKVTKLAKGDVEIAIDEVRLEVHVDDGAGAAEDAKRSFMAQFTAADTDNNGYLEKAELTKDKDHPSPLAGLFDILDRDGDGKLYPKELDDFVDRQSAAARSRTVLTSADEGRAIFAILDLNRDRRLGIREVRNTLARVSSWDRDADGRITADEIPHHYQVTIGRSGLAGIRGAGIVAQGPMLEQAAAAPEAGPSWFRRMDRNRDGDISRREFRGPRAQFDRMDRDKDGLIDANEAAAAATTAKVAETKTK